MLTRCIDVKAEPVGVARRLACSFDDVALLHSGRSAVSYVAAGADRFSNALDPFEGGEETEWGGVPRWIGVIPYEARRGLERAGWRAEDRRAAPVMAAPEWRRFPAVVRLDEAAGEVRIVGDDERAVSQLERAIFRGDAAPTAVTCSLETVPDPSAHVRRVQAARELILNGDLYQVNLARRFAVSVHTPETARTRALVSLYERMAGAVPSRFGALLMLPSAAVISTSPELLLRAEALNGQFTTLRTEPIKGTRPRGADAEADAALVRELETDAKEQAELAMIIDVERHDLGTVCEPGAVCIEVMPRVTTHATVHHREAVLTGRTNASREAVLSAMVPSGSVTGAPKVRAMEVIAELESDRRGLYTGGIGYVARDGAVTLSMAIRTLVVRGDQGFYFTGGGIVLDSDPERERLETEWKARRLFDALSSAHPVPSKISGVP